MERRIKKSPVFFIIEVALLILPGLSTSSAALLTLEDCIKIAFQRHGTVSIAKESALAASAKLVQARSTQLPQLLGGYDVVYSQAGGGERFASLGGLPVALGSGSNFRQQVTFSLGKLWYDRGLTRSHVRQAMSNKQAAEDSLEIAYQDLSLQVAQSFFAVLAAQALVEVARAEVSQIEQHLQAVDARIEIGSIAQVDRLPVLTKLADARLNMVVADNAVRQGVADLRNSMGLSVGESVELARPVEPDGKELKTSLSDLVKESQQRRELRRLKAQWDAAHEAVLQARLQQNAMVTVTTAANFKALPGEPGWDLVVAAAVIKPLRDGGNAAARVQQAVAEEAVVRLAYEQMQRDISTETEKAYLSLVNAAERRKASQTGLEEANLTLDAVTEKYRLGRAISLEVMDAQVACYTAGLKVSQARFDYFLALASLHRAVGSPLLSRDPSGKAGS